MQNIHHPTRSLANKLRDKGEVVQGTVWAMALPCRAGYFPRWVFMLVYHLNKHNLLTVARTAVALIRGTYSEGVCLALTLTRIGRKLAVQWHLVMLSNDQRHK